MCVEIFFEILKIYKSVLLLLLKKMVNSIKNIYYVLYA